VLRLLLQDHPKVYVLFQNCSKNVGFMLKVSGKIPAIYEMIQGQGQGRCEILIPSLPNDS
jgi:hypothetical protein